MSWLATFIVPACVILSLCFWGFTIASAVRAGRDCDDGSGDPISFAGWRTRR